MLKKQVFDWMLWLIINLEKLFHKYKIAIHPHTQFIGVY